MTVQDSHRELLEVMAANGWLIGATVLVAAAASVLWGTYWGLVGVWRWLKTTTTT